jgi:hypothetical protein
MGVGIVGIELKRRIDKFVGAGDVVIPIVAQPGADIRGGHRVAHGRRQDRRSRTHLPRTIWRV